MNPRTSSWLLRAGARAVDLLFPPVCVACSTEIGELVDQICLCQSCRDLLPKAHGPLCRCCGAKVPAVPGAVDSCHHCCEHRLRFDETHFWGRHEGLLQELVLRMKTDASQQVANVLGSLLVQAFGEELLADGVDALVPIPPIAIVGFPRVATLLTQSLKW